MSGAVGLAWDLLARDQASPAFLRVAGAADKAAASTAKATAAMSTTTARLGALGKTMTKAITVPLVGIAAVAVDQAAKFQKSMTLLQTAGGEAASNLALVSKGIEKIAVKTGTSLGDLSDGMYVVEKAGIRGAAGLKVLQAAAEGAKAENVDLGTAVNALTSVMMSYHLSADKSVQVENMLIRGAGMAKTTMQEYAGSLSTVIPIASAAGINFAQVAGAIATLTQHGTSAQEATQELANTIRNLQAPNNVAVKAMQQLGLNVVDVEKNLGKRGLTGTIDLLTAAIAKHLGKDGLVAVSAFKQSQSASADLNVELSKMPAKLADLSKQFMGGKIGYQTYYKAIKQLDAGQYELGKSFITTLGQAKGFNDLLKSGNPAAQTFAAYLKQMMGGATGLNTALMLGGENMRYFTSATKDVAQAALNAGADVLGWNKTQDTLAVKMDKAKASLQVMAVEIGTALIPVVSKLADGVGKVIHWFDSLSGSQRKVLGWSLGVLAALGPVFMISGKLAVLGSKMGSFAASAGTKLAGLAGASEATATRFGTAMGRIGRAMGALAVGAAASTVGGNSAGGWLGSILLGAAGGAAIGGGIGAVVGGVSAAIFKGIDLWNQHKDAAKQAAAAEKTYIASLSDAINADNGLLGTNLKLTVTKALQSQGILDQAQKLGISLADVVSAAMGNSSAFSKDIAAKIATLGPQINAKEAYLSAHADIGEAKGLAISKQIQALQAEKTALEKLQTAVTGAGGDTQKAVAQYAQLEHVMNDNRVATGNYASQLKTLAQHASLAIDANGQLATSLDRGTVVGAHNANTIEAVAKAAQVDAEQTFAAALKHHSYADALKAANSVLTSHVKQIESVAVAAGLSKGAVAALVTKYGTIPKSVLTYIQKKGVLPADVQAIVDAYNRIPKTITTVVTTKTVGDLASTYRSQVPGVHRANGGGVGDGYFTVGERGWELGYKRGNRVEIFPHGASVAMTGMKRVPGFASGTPTGSALQTVVSAIAGLLSAGHNPNSTASDLSTAAAALRQAAYDQKTSAEFQRSMAVQSARLVGLGGRRDAIAARLGIAPAATTAYDQLSTARQDYANTFTGVRSAFVGSFDITTAGQIFSDRAATAGTILSALRKAARNAGRFGALLRKLTAEGLNKGLIGQLAAAGPGALSQAEALAKATPAQIVGLNAGYRDLVSAADVTGNFMATELNGAGVRAAEGLVKGLLSEKSALDKAIRSLGDSMVAELKKTLKIHSPSRVMRELGQHTGEGYRLGLLDKHAAVKRAAESYANAAQRAGSGVGSGGGDTFNFYGITDLDAIYAGVQRRQYMRAV